MQGDVGREDLLWEGRLEEGRESFLEDAQSLGGLGQHIQVRSLPSQGAWGRFRAHFCLTLLCGHLGVCWVLGPEVAWCLHRERSG